MDNCEQYMMEPLAYPEEDEVLDTDIEKHGGKRFLTAGHSSGLNKRQRLVEDDLLLKQTNLFIRDRKTQMNQKQNLLFTDSDCNGSPNGQPPLLQDISLPKVKFRRVLKRLPSDIPYLPLTCENGTRLYLRLKEQNYSDDDSDEYENIPVSHIKTGNDIIANWNQTRAEANVLLQKMYTSKFEHANNNDDTGSSDSSKHCRSLLWTDKYKARNFLDLLSPEAINVALLHWIKLWDNFVFGRDYMAKVKDTRIKYSRLLKNEQENAERFNQKSFLPPNEEYDTAGRPVMKVALLAGDPGLGKTTIAHIVAKHAGYYVHEVNASDDRSLDKFKKILDDTIQSKTEIFKNGLPNCLVLDEIDGAPAASVNLLVDFITGKLRETGKKKVVKVIRRPIICICNDLYVPALRLLRQHAFVLQFPCVPIPRLMERLRHVGSMEGLRINDNILFTLCKKFDCDIRSCLLTLQFFKAQSCSFDEAMLAQVGIGDKSLGLFNIWKQLFGAGCTYKFQYNTKMATLQRFLNIKDLVQNFGDYERLFAGVFENYTSVSSKDVYLESILDCLDWSNWFEEIRNFMFRNQSFGLYGYPPMFFVKTHFLFGRKDFSFKLKLPSNKMMAGQALKSGMINHEYFSKIPVSVSRFNDPQSLIMDVFPAILNLIQPATIRSVPFQLLNQRERIICQNVVDIMLNFNITYVQELCHETGKYFMQLQPDLEQITRFDVDMKKNKSENLNPYADATKQYIANEITTTKIRRNQFLPEVSENAQFATKISAKRGLKTNANFNLKAIDCAKGPVDFFGRPKPTKVVEKRHSETTTRLSRSQTSQVYFKYQNGHTNAVKRHVKMRDLL